ncbi:MAG: hypothetical protein WC527_01000 [Candidatus Margulisiibacteriota bacterium]
MKTKMANITVYVDRNFKKPEQVRSITYLGHENVFLNIANMTRSKPQTFYIERAGIFSTRGEQLQGSEFLARTVIPTGVSIISFPGGTDKTNIAGTFQQLKKIGERILDVAFPQNGFTLDIKSCTSHLFTDAQFAKFYEATHWQGEKIVRFGTSRNCRFPCIKEASHAPCNIS